MLRRSNRLLNPRNRSITETDMIEPLLLYVKDSRQFIITKVNYEGEQAVSLEVEAVNSKQQYKVRLTRTLIKKLQDLCWLHDVKKPIGFRLYKGVNDRNRPVWEIYKG